MCTLTYLPKGDTDFILGSSRDVMRVRALALPPKMYGSKTCQLYYAKDGQAGGTWLGISSKKRLVCLLNGAYDFYMPDPPYRKSRGQIVLEALEFNLIDQVLEMNDFDGIEPFSMLIIDWVDEIRLFELRWDGVIRHLNALKNEPFIWSSSTLFTPLMKAKREAVFDQWTQGLSEVKSLALMDFHNKACADTPESAINMKRKFFCTVSISILEKKGLGFEWRYQDILRDTSHISNIEFD